MPQDANDEPASVLLDKIKAEKAQLIKEKKIKKSKALPAITDEEKPFAIPESWEWVRLGDILQVSSGKQLKKKDLIENGVYSVYGANGIIGSYSEYNTKKNTLLIGRVGFYAGSVHITESEAWVTDNSLIVRKIGEIYINWLYYALIFLNVGKISSQTAQPVISGSKIYRIMCPLPPLAEQKRIVAKIEECMQAIKTVKDSSKEYENLQNQLDKKVLDLAIRGKLVPQDANDEPASVLLDKIKAEKAQLIKEKKIKKSKALLAITDEEKPFTIPESWEWVRLGEITKKLTDGTHNPPVNSGKGKQVISAVNIKNGEINFSLSNRFVTDEQFLKEDKRTHIRKGDVLLTIVGSLGNAAIVKTNDRFTAQRSVAILNSSINSEYFYFAIISNSFKKQILNNAKGTTQKGIYLKKLANLIIPLPPLAEQQRIVAKIEEIKQYLV
ncbi:restriction endonuclease subunit S [Ligilactobacillus saerimneri]